MHPDFGMHFVLISCSFLYPHKRTLALVGTLNTPSASLTVNKPTFLKKLRTLIAFSLIEEVGATSLIVLPIILFKRSAA